MLAATRSEISTNTSGVAGVAAACRDLMGAASLLPRAEYANGPAFFGRRPREPAARRLPVIVHNNWIAGFEAKRARFESHGLWLVGSPDHGDHRCRLGPSALAV